MFIILPVATIVIDLITYLKANYQYNENRLILQYGMFGNKHSNLNYKQIEKVEAKLFSRLVIYVKGQKKINLPFVANSTKNYDLLNLKIQNRKSVKKELVKE
ncbi:UNVERIFIED_CONTAM: PH domain-containing protein [Campylobacter lari]